MKLQSLIKLLFLALISQAAFSQSAQEINDKALETMSYSAMEMSSTLKILDNKDRERIRQITTVSKKFGEVNKTLIEFTAPADIKGTSMLIYDYDRQDDDMWIFLPALRKTRRIVSTEKGKSFMGSEFSNADMSRPNEDDFTHRILDQVDYQGKMCWKIESTCKSEELEDMYGYSRKVSWIEKNTYLCYKIEYFDFDDAQYKVQIFDRYMKQDNGKYFAYLMKMENTQNGRKSIMSIDDFKSSANYPESYFAPATLSR